MGCGGSKDKDVMVVELGHHKQDKFRTKTPSSSSSSSSGISSYRRSQSLRHSDRPGSNNVQQDLNQNKEEQHKQQDSQRETEKQLAAERQKREARIEEERRLQEQQLAAEEKRCQERVKAEEFWRQEEALSQQQENQVAVVRQQSVSAGLEQDGSKSFTPLEIFQHNHELGWIEWIPYKSKVYDANGIRSYFPGYMDNRPAMMEARVRQRVAEGGEEKEKEFVTFITPSTCERFPSSITDAYAWCYNGIILLRVRGISEEELAKELPRFLMGNMVGTSGPAYFDSIRKDVAMLLQDFQAPSDGGKPSGKQEYQALLMRWQNKYGAMDPPSQSPGTDGSDPNNVNFPLPVDPDSLRLYLLEGENLDFAIPAEGAWSSYEIEKIDLGDPHENFLAILRADFSTEDFMFEVEGEVAWEVLSDNAIKEDQMTPKQEEIQASRAKRTDLNDVERMKRRRQELCDYFIDIRELAPDVVMPFMQWASLMEASQAELDKLSSS